MIQFRWEIWHYGEWSVRQTTSYGKPNFYIYTVCRNRKRQWSIELLHAWGYSIYFFHNFNFLFIRFWFHFWWLYFPKKHSSFSQNWHFTNFIFTLASWNKLKILPNLIKWESTLEFRALTTSICLRAGSFSSQRGRHARDGKKPKRQSWCQKAKLWTAVILTGGERSYPFARVSEKGFASKMR